MARVYEIDESLGSRAVDPANTTLVGLLSGLFSAAAAGVWSVFHPSIPVGYEDSAGFHYGEQGARNTHEGE